MTGNEEQLRQFASLTKQMEDMRKTFTPEQLQTLASMEDNPTEARQRDLRTYLSNTTKIETPKLIEGLSYTEYKTEVEIWQRTCRIMKSEQAMLLLNNLPSKDNYRQKIAKIHPILMQYNILHLLIIIQLSFHTY